MIKLKHGQNIRSLIRRKVKGKLFRKKCEGCILVRSYKEDGSVCPVPYRDMPLCPCQKCLVKVMCNRFCNRFNA